MAQIPSPASSFISIKKVRDSCQCPVPSQAQSAAFCLKLFSWPYQGETDSGGEAMKRKNRCYMMLDVCSFPQPWYHGII
jgi:hypothetical protein